MRETHAMALAAGAGFLIVFALMALNISIDQGVTGAAVADIGSGYTTGAIIVISLLVMGLIWLVHTKLSK